MPSPTPPWHELSSRVLDFHILGADSGWNDPALTAGYQRGLSNELQTELACCDEDPGRITPHYPGWTNIGEVRASPPRCALCTVHFRPSRLEKTPNTSTTDATTEALQPELMQFGSSAGVGAIATQQSLPVLWRSSTGQL